MRHINAILLAALAVAPSSPVSACTIIYQPFSQYLPRLLHGEIAIKSRMQVSFSNISEDHWSGTLRFEPIRCIKVKPRGLHCPRSLSLAFDEARGDVSCPSALDDSRLERSEGLRYFLLWDDGDGWRLRMAREHFDR